MTYLRIKEAVFVEMEHEANKTVVNLKTTNVVILGILFSLSACLKREKPAPILPVKYVTEQTCQLNFDNISNIFSENISKDIDCLEKNFEDYIKVVRKSDERYIEYGELKRFVQHFYRETRQIPDGVFESAFGMTSFFLGESERKISVNQVKNVFNLIRFLNQKVPPLLGELQSDNGIYAEKRDILKERLEFFAQEFKNMLGPSETDDSAVKININHFLQKVGIPGILAQDKLDFFSTMGGAFKRMFVGGDEQEITFQEFVNLIDKLPQIVLFLKDYTYFNQEKDSLPPEQSSLMLYKFLSVFPGLLHQDFKRDEIIFTSKQLSLLAKYLYPSFKYDQFEQYITFLKAKMLDGGNRRNWSYGNIVHLFHWGRMIFGSSYFNRITYRHYLPKHNYKVILGKNAPRLKEYAIFSQDDIVEHWANFKSIITKHRYFKNNNMESFVEKHGAGGRRGILKIFVSIDNDEDEKDRNEFDIIDEFLIENKSVNSVLQDDVQEQPFSNSDKMLVQTLNEISTIKIIVSALVKKYGKDGVVDKDGLKRFLQDFEPLLNFLTIDLTISDEAAVTILNQIDYLQFHSDGNHTADVEELTEFVTSLFFARRLAAELYLDLRQYCNIQYDGSKDRHYFETDCYRKRFVKNFFEDRNYQIYFNGSLSDPVFMRDKKHYWNYFINLEHISKKKDERNEKIMMDKGGLVRLMLAFFNVEGMCDRLDRDKNGIIDIAELNSMYKIFRSLVYKEVGSSLLSFMDKEKWIKSIFLYIVDKHKRPDGTALAWFHYTRNSENITTDREKVSFSLRAFLGSEKVPELDTNQLKMIHVP